MNNQSMLNQVQQLESEDSVDLKKIFQKVASKWHWFIICIFIGLISAFLYCQYTAPIYQISAKLLVNDEEKGGSLSKQSGGLMDLGGLLGAKNSVDNEVEILKTRFLMEQVVRQLQLNVVYGKSNNLVNREIYKSPFKINLIQEVDTMLATKIKVQLQKNGKSLQIESENLERDIKWGEWVSLPGVGKIQIEKRSDVNMDFGKYYALLVSIDERVASLMKQLSAEVTNKQVSTIDLGLSYPVPQKGEDILNMFIQKYTEANLSDKNAIADSTYRFIKQRLNVIASELGDVENDVEGFKRRNQLADMSEQGKILVQNTAEFSTELAKAETQVNILNDLEKYLRSSTDSKRVFPSSLLPQDLVFSNLMAQYNALLVERERQLLSVTEESPFVKNIDTQVSGLRADILSNVQSSKNTYVRTRDKLRSQLKEAEGNISGVPQIEKNYLKLARNQQIKQELYVFLMQKAEETAISKTSNISIAKTIDPPKAQAKPISPKKTIVYFAGLIAGLVIPMALIFGLDLLNNTISTKEDIKNMTIVPIVGEISHNPTEDNTVVANQSRSAISEQFRALRTNLSFYLKSESEKIILLTSSMSGEGKSFTAINLGNILALAGKKVLLMELDLRRPGLSAKLDIKSDMGFSNYTIDPNVKIDHIVKPLSINKNMFIIPSGPLPPNPAETLMSEHTPKLIEDLKKQFDYIIMDAPPIGIITDAQLLSHYADVVLYLIRPKVTQKDHLAIVDELYRNDKMKNLGIVVNDIVSKTYGYGYGYGNYGAANSSNQSFFIRLKKFFKN